MGYSISHQADVEFFSFLCHGGVSRSIVTQAHHCQPLTNAMKLLETSRTQIHQESNLRHFNETGAVVLVRYQCTGMALRLSGKKIQQK